MAVGGVSKPAVRSVWGISAGAANLADPGDAFAALGWPLSPDGPTRQTANWLENYIFNGVRYQNARGLPDWDATEVCYSIGSLVIGDDGIVRVALQNGPQAQTVGTNSNQPPSTASAYWGSPKFPTPTALDNSTKAATTAYADAAVAVEAANRTSAVSAEATARANAVSAEASARAAGDSNTFNAAATYTNAQVAPLATIVSPALTGTPTAPTAALGTNSSQLATTAFVQNATEQNIGASQVNAIINASVLVGTSPTNIVGFANLEPNFSYMLEAFCVVQNNGGASLSLSQVVSNVNSITPQGQQFNLSAQGSNNLFQPHQFNAASASPGLPISGANPSTLNLNGVFTMPAGATSILYQMASGGGSFSLLSGTVFRLTRVA